MARPPAVMFPRAMPLPKGRGPCHYPKGGVVRVDKEDVAPVARPDGAGNRLGARDGPDGPGSQRIDVEDAPLVPALRDRHLHEETRRVHVRQLSTAWRPGGAERDAAARGAGLGTHRPGRTQLIETWIGPDRRARDVLATRCRGQAEPDVGAGIDLGDFADSIARRPLVLPARTSVSWSISVWPPDAAARRLPRWSTFGPERLNRRLVPRQVVQSRWLREPRR